MNCPLRLWWRCGQRGSVVHTSAASKRVTPRGHGRRPRAAGSRRCGAVPRRARPRRRGIRAGARSRGRSAAAAGSSGSAGGGRCQRTQLSLPTWRVSCRQSTSRHCCGAAGDEGAALPPRPRPRSGRCAPAGRPRAARRWRPSISVIPASASSLGSRSCSVRKARSERPRACGE